MSGSTTPENTSAPSTAPTGVTAAYTVTGMTCGHCVTAVSTEIGKLTGVSDVRVDLDTGTVTVTSSAPLVDSEVAAAVDEAGYELAPAGGARG